MQSACLDRAVSSIAGEKKFSDALASSLHPFKTEEISKNSQIYEQRQWNDKAILRVPRKLRNLYKALLRKKNSK